MPCARVLAPRACSHPRTHTGNTQGGYAVSRDTHMYPNLNVRTGH